MNMFSKTRNGALRAGLCLAATLTIAGAMPAAAADFGPPEEQAAQSPWYISIFGGANIHTQDVDFTNGTTTVATDFDGGFTFGGALGREWQEYGVSGLVPRTEVEFSYSENDVDSLDFSGNGAGNENVAPGSQVSAVGILFNLYLDAPDLIGGGFTPYFGGGIGLNIFNHNLLYNAAGVNLNDNDDVVFAWHLTGGVKYAITENTSFFTDVGFHQAIDAGSLRRAGNVPVVGAGGGTFRDDINSIVVKAGITVSFDAF